MIKKYLLRKLFNLYREEFREINKISVEEEYELYLMKKPDDCIKLIKSLTTCQVMRVFESKNDEERAMNKGAAMILKIMKDASNKAWELNSIQDEDERIKKWRQFKTKNRTN